ncbi:Sterol desaturase/sphingolipid hydroxylase, fatty acid hydroxylase superfamily [Chitinophaga costaii]|uniref:Sterol desaturase/sphingolipid hydroxylase, fatty acid hydroxylase superfamily n=1 Tax=Chitinophaga costaii TaxID=1335309 RepID=A0A1C3YQ27_9BACT|nr:sterol desaturase family protein [Chitinophaga costaii]PUZ30052.1 sterol desaturase family protein [Chitinophaga costaii]SCB72205.1 Sterol desaturase/sphingolipid hydroxylase, fatty acid hydroxylase superfamily [Chitinophaga costaii]
MEQLSKTIAVIFSITLVRYLVLAGIPFLLFYLLLETSTSKYKIQKRKAVKKDFFREILHSSSSSLVFSIMVGILLFTPLKSHTLLYTDVQAYPLWWLPASLVLSLVIHDTYFYWMHRLLHHKSIFKYTHLVHHQSVNPSPWTSYSFHIVEAVTEGAILPILAFTLPMQADMLIIFTVVSLIINVYGHLGYEIMPKGLRQSYLFEVINTSVYHNLHHSKFKGNYSLYFRWWDKLMKTENPDYVKEYDRIQEQRFGEVREVAKAA